MTRQVDAGAARGLLEGPGVARLLAALDGAGEETRIVGGAVRNALIGRVVSEVDLATTALPGETMRRAAEAGFKAVPTGIAHGTVTVVIAGEPFEVTTLRQDVATDGRHAIVRFGRDFAADAVRRDFTVNALSIGRDGVVHDVTGGIADLAAGRVRFIGEARQRIREDFLRILRFFRFSAEYAEGAVDAEGLDAAIRERAGLDTLSRERVGAELMKLLVARRAAEFVQLMAGTGLLGRLTGGVCDLGRLARAAGTDAAAPDPVIRLAAAFVATGADADRLRDRLRLSNAVHARLSAYAGAVTRLRSVESPSDAPEIRRAAATFGIAALRDALAPLDGEPRPLMSDAARAQAGRYLSGAEVAPTLPVTGAELLRRGLTPGPEVGLRLGEARAAWLAAGCPVEWSI